MNFHHICDGTPATVVSFSVLALGGPDGDIRTTSYCRFSDAGRHLRFLPHKALLAPTALKWQRSIRTSAWLTSLSVSGPSQIIPVDTASRIAD